MDFLEIYDLAYNRICILTDNSVNGAKDIKEEYKLNGINTLSFSLPLTSDKWQNIINENLVKWKGEYYFVKSPSFNHSTDGKSLSVTCEHLSSGLQGIQNPQIKQVGSNATDLIKIVLGEGGTAQSTSGWKVGYVNIPSDKARSLETTGEQSVFTNLIKIAELFDAQLNFNSEPRTVDLIENTNDRNIQIRKGKNLQSLDFSYDTSEITTRLYAFGANDEETGQPINIMSVNPTAHAYIENYSFYLNQGYTMDYINQHPELFLKESTWNASEYVDAQQLYDDAVKKLNTSCQPKVTCTVQGLDLSSFPQHFVESPILGEKVYIIDMDLNLFVQAKVIGIRKESGKPLATSIDVSNEIVYSSVLKQLVDASKAVNKIVTPSQQILGQYIKEATIDTAHIKNASITTAKIEQAFIDKVDANVANINLLKADYASINNLVAQKASIEDLNATNASISNLHADKANIDDLNATNAVIGDLTADVGHFNTVFADVLEAGQIIAGSSIIADEAIGNSHISSLNADKINAGTIDTSKVVVQGQNAKLKISGNRLQVFDQSEQLETIERVSLGDVNGDGTVYGLRVRGADGVTVLLDEDGVKSEGITDGSITNSKISNNAQIDGTKLDIATVVTAINNGTETITGSKVFLTDKTLDVELSEIKTTQTAQGTTIANHTSQISALSDEIDLKVSTQTFDTTIGNLQNDMVYKVDIVSTNGAIFKNGQVTTDLIAKLYHGGTDITNTISASRFIWTRVSTDSAGDTTWNNAHSTGTKQISITSSDVNSRATFICEILEA